MLDLSSITLVFRGLWAGFGLTCWQDERYHTVDVLIHEMEQGLQAMERSIGSM